MNKDDLHELLIDIQNNNYINMSQFSTLELAHIMLTHIGDKDPDLRDNLIVPTLMRWLENNNFSNSEMKELLKTLLDENHLLKGLGTIDNRVFFRTASIEIVTGIIHKHRNRKFISKQDLYNAFNKVLKFYNEDIDVRGYIENNGWACGAAQGADTLDEFVHCDELKADDIKKILDALYNKVNTNHYGFIHFEDERIITVIQSILEENILSVNEIQKWLQKFKTINRINKYPEDLIVDFNRNTFLKSLFFRLADNEDYRELCDEISIIIKSISKFR